MQQSSNSPQFELEIGNVYSAILNGTPEHAENLLNENLANEKYNGVYLFHTALSKIIVKSVQYKKWLEIFYNCKVNLELTDAKGNNALGIVVSLNDPFILDPHRKSLILESLVQNGADPLKPNNAGLDSIELAKNLGQNDLASILERENNKRKEAEVIKISLEKENSNIPQDSSWQNWSFDMSQQPEYTQENQEEHKKIEEQGATGSSLKNNNADSEDDLFGNSDDEMQVDNSSKDAEAIQEIEAWDKEIENSDNKVTDEEVATNLPVNIQNTSTTKDDLSDEDDAIALEKTTQKKKPVKKKPKTKENDSDDEPTKTANNQDSSKNKQILKQAWTAMNKAVKTQRAADIEATLVEYKDHFTKNYIHEETQESLLLKSVWHTYFKEAVLDIFIKLGFDFNVQDKDGNNIFNLAITSPRPANKIDLVIRLIENKVSPFEPNNLGQNALTIAKTKKELTIAKILENFEKIDEENFAQFITEIKKIQTKIKDLGAAIRGDSWKKALQFIDQYTANAKTTEGDYWFLNALYQSNCNQGLLEKFLEEGADPNAQDKNGNTPLLIILRNEKLTIATKKLLINILLAFEADPEVSNLNGVSAKSFATNIGEEELISLLSESNINDLNLKLTEEEKEQYKLLCAAILSRNAEDTKKLLTERLVNLPNKAGNPLFLAAIVKFDYEQSIILDFIAKGADLKMTNSDLNTAAHLVIINSKKVTEFTLLKAIKILVNSEPTLLVKKNRDQKTIKILAQEKGYNSIVEFIDNYNPSSSSSSESIISEFMTKEEQEQYKKFSKFLVKLDIEGMDSTLLPSMVNKKHGKYGDGYIFHISLNKEAFHLKVFNAFINKGVNINLKDQDGNTAFMLFLDSERPIEKHKLAIKFLNQKGIDIVTKNKKGQDAHSIAVMKGYFEIANMIKDYSNTRADDLPIFLEELNALPGKITSLYEAIRKGSISGIKPLLDKYTANARTGKAYFIHSAYDRTDKHFAVLKDFLNAGANPMIRDDENNSLLMVYLLKAKKVNIEEVRFLIKKAVRLDLLNNKFQTAETIAASKGLKDIVQEIRKYSISSSSSSNIEELPEEELLHSNKRKNYDSDDELLEKQVHKKRKLTSKKRKKETDDPDDELAHKSIRSENEVSEVSQEAVLLLASKFTIPEKEVAPLEATQKQDNLVTIEKPTSSPSDVQQSSSNHNPLLETPPQSDLAENKPPQIKIGNILPRAIRPPKKTGDNDKAVFYVREEIYHNNIFSHKNDIFQYKPVDSGKSLNPEKLINIPLFKEDFPVLDTSKEAIEIPENTTHKSINLCGCFNLPEIKTLVLSIGRPNYDAIDRLVAELGSPIKVIYKYKSPDGREETYTETFGPDYGINPIVFISDADGFRSSSVTNDFNSLEPIRIDHQVIQANNWLEISTISLAISMLILGMSDFHQD